MVTTRSRARAIVYTQHGGGQQEAAEATPSSSSNSSRFSWFSLPPEVRTMILDEVARVQFFGWASSTAPVCREWQAIIAPRNFRQLNLWASDLPQLERMVVSNRCWVRYISLSMQLPRYTCSCCYWDIDSTRTKKHKNIMGRALLNLFTVLTTWEPVEHGGLELELNARSPSDTKHWVKDHCAGLTYEPDGDLVEAQRSGIKRYQDLRHAWLLGKQTGERPLPFQKAIVRPYSEIDIKPPGDLPIVPAITGLVIRREFRRQMTPEALRLLFSNLPRLEKIVYELWRIRWNAEKVASYKEALASLIRDHLPPSVRPVAIYEEFSKQLADALRYTGTKIGQLNKDKTLQDPYSIGGHALDRVFARRSRELEHLAVSYLVDAAAFFHACSRSPSYQWPRLRTLTLTAPRLWLPDDARKVSNLLQTAGLVAARIPRLQRLVLWSAAWALSSTANSRTESAWAFTYQKQAEKRQATITWRGTWSFKFDRRVVEAWEKVASLGSPCCQLVVNESERVKGVTIQSRGDAIYRLRIPDDVIDPVSLWQSRIEGMAQNMA